MNESYFLISNHQLTGIFSRPSGHGRGKVQSIIRCGQINQTWGDNVQKKFKIKKRFHLNSVLCIWNTFTLLLYGLAWTSLFEAQCLSGLPWMYHESVSTGIFNVSQRPLCWKLTWSPACGAVRRRGLQYVGSLGSFTVRSLETYPNQAWWNISGIPAIQEAEAGRLPNSWPAWAT